MPHTPKRSTLTTLFLATAVAVPVTAFDAGSAQADVTVQVNGQVKVRVNNTQRKRIRIRTRHRRHRTHHPRVRLRIGGGIHIYGSAQVGDFAQPPPPPPPPVHDCDDHVPAYYTDVAPPPPPPPVVYRTRYQVVQQPAPVVVRASEPRLPRFAVGAFAGSLNVDNRVTGEDVGLFGRLRLTDSFLVEAEVASARMMDIRTDRRVGGALLYDLWPRSRVSAHVLAGGGVTHVNVQDGMFESKQEYGEIGAGLNVRLTPRLHLSADLRAGARASVDEEPTDIGLKAVAPSADGEEKYTRGRISAIFYF